MRRKVSRITDKEIREELSDIDRKHMVNENIEKRISVILLLMTYGIGVSVNLVVETKGNSVFGYVAFIFILIFGLKDIIYHMKQRIK